MVSSTGAPSSAAGAEGDEEEAGERNTESTAFVGGELTKPGGEFVHFAPDMYSANDIAMFEREQGFWEGSSRCLAIKVPRGEFV